MNSREQIAQIKEQEKQLDQAICSQCTAENFVGVLDSKYCYYRVGELHIYVRFTTPPDDDSARRRRKENDHLANTLNKSFWGSAYVLAEPVPDGTNLAELIHPKCSQEKSYEIGKPFFIIPLSSDYGSFSGFNLNIAMPKQRFNDSLVKHYRGFKIPTFYPLLPAV